MQADSQGLVSLRLLVTVHGIRTFGEWQDRLERLVSADPDGLEVCSIRYGYFSVLAFMVPLVRRLAARRVRELLRAKFAEREWARVDIVAHSFGTYLVAHALRGIDSWEGRKTPVGTVILAGSVLRLDFPWRKLMFGEGACVTRVVNECGTKDSILLLSHLFVPLASMAGRVGFEFQAEGIRFRNRYHDFGHSGYFQTDGRPNDFMQRWWLPLLAAEPAELEAQDQRTRLNAFRGARFAFLKFFEVPKLAAYLLLAAAVALPIFRQYQEAQVRLNTLSEAERLAELSASAEGDPELSLLLAIESARVGADRGIGPHAVAQARLEAALETVSDRQLLTSVAGVDRIDISSAERSAVLFGTSGGAFACDLVDADFTCGVLPMAARAQGAVTWSSDESIVAISLGDTIGIWSQEKGGPASESGALSEDALPWERRSVSTARGDGPFRFIAIDAGDTLIAAERDGYVPVWNLRADDPSQPIREFAISVGFNATATFSPDSRWLMIWGSRRFALMDMRKSGPDYVTGWRASVLWENTQDFDDGENAYAHFFSPSGDWLAVAHFTMYSKSSQIIPGAVPLRPIFMWRLPDDTMRANPRHRLDMDSRVTGLTFSADGAYVRASSERVTRTWRVDGANQTEVPLDMLDALERVEWDEPRVTSGEFPDLVLDTADLPILRVWSRGSTSASIVDRACRTISREFTPAEWTRVFGRRPPRPTCPSRAVVPLDEVAKSSGASNDAI